MFAVWAPNAKSVSVVCDQNGWDANLGRMRRHINSGIWEVFIPGVCEGQNYKFSIDTYRGETVLKAQKKMVMTPGEMEKVVIDLGKVDQDVAVCVEEG